MTRHDTPVDFLESQEIQPIFLTLLLLARCHDVLSGIMALSRCYPNVPVNNYEQLRELLQLLEKSPEGSLEKQELQDKSLRLILQLLKNPEETSNEQHERLKNELFKLLPKLPGFRKRRDPNILDADFDGLVQEAYLGFFKTFPRLLHQLDLENTADDELRKRIVKWFNRIIQNKVCDYYRQLKRQPIPVSLDASNISEEGKEFNLGGVADDTTQIGIEQLIEQEQAKKMKDIGRKVRQYIEEDPTGELQSSYPNEKIDKNRPNTSDNSRPRPDANCHVLAQRLLLKDPPDDLSAIAREFKISRPTLDSQWKRKGQEHVKKMATNFGYEPENDPE